MLQSINKVIVHGGSAHRDDFLTVCCALAITGSETPVFRKDPSEAELDDPRCLVADVGRRHEPELSNLDHHQFERDHEPTSGFSLFCEWAELYDFGIYQWYEFTSWLDSKGPNQTADHYNIPKESLMATISPVETALINIFEETKGENALPAALKDIMAVIGANIIEEAQDLMNDLTHQSKVVEVVSIMNQKVGIFRTSETNGQQLWRKNNCPEMAASISLAKDRNTDEETGGWTLYRYDDHPNVDFSILESSPDMSFAHKGGFIGITQPCTEEVALGLVAKSIK